MVTLLVICVPFGPAADPLSYFLWGTAYCLFLAFFAVGLCLAMPNRIVLWWLLSILVPLLVNVGSLLSFWVYPEVVLRAWILASCAVAAWGWVWYIRWHRVRDLRHLPLCR
jgi:hypothetical protein